MDSTLTDILKEGTKHAVPLMGKTIILNGIPFAISVPFHDCISNGAVSEVPWTDAINGCGDSDSLWHWSSAFSLVGGQELPYMEKNTQSDVLSFSAVGFVHPQATLTGFHASSTTNMGFRPTLTPLTISDEINRLHNPFYGMKNGETIRKFSVLLDGQPVAMDKPDSPASFQNNTKESTGSNRIQFVDTYFGDRYLIPWIVFGGRAIAAQNILIDISWDALVNHKLARLAVWFSEEDCK